MLALRRKEGESVNVYLEGKYIGYVKVVEIQGKSARLGFEFPSDYGLFRGEISGGDNPGSQGSGNPVPRNNPQRGLEAKAAKQEGEKE